MANSTQATGTRVQTGNPVLDEINLIFTKGVDIWSSFQDAKLAKSLATAQAQANANQTPSNAVQALSMPTNIVQLMVIATAGIVLVSGAMWAFKKARR